MNTNKLTIEHITPYLPNGLMCRTYANEGYADYILVGLELINYDFLSYFKEFGEWNSDQFKPILRPLSDLGEQEFIIEGERFYHYSEVDISSLSYFQMLHLIKDKFDVFNLIEKDLAIDVNTLKENPYSNVSLR